MKSMLAIVAVLMSMAGAWAGEQTQQQTPTKPHSRPQSTPQNKPEMAQTKLGGGVTEQHGFERALSEARRSDQHARELIRAGERDGAADKLAALLDEDDLLINQYLKVAYRTARPATKGKPSNDMLRTAVLHWSAATRRLLQDSLHTQVAGLEDDPDCKGDVVADALMLRYADAVLDPAPAGREARVVAALTPLARQSACLSTQQSNLYATALVASFDEVAKFLRVNGQETTVPLLAALASQPMLLFYDVEKWRGQIAPLSLWYSNYREILRQVIAASRHPSQWHQLWLYDRRTGLLVGYKPTRLPKDENHIDLELFFQSIIDSLALGGNDCSFHEMVSRGPSQAGYVCAGAACKQKETLPGHVNNTPWMNRPSGSTPFGGGNATMQGLAESAFCPAGGDAPGHGGGGLCASVNTGVGGSTIAAQQVACVAATAMSPGERQMRCVAEATGMCANPIDRFTKQMQETIYAGVKIGKNCQISQTDGPMVISPEEAQRQRDAWGVDYYKKQWENAESKALDAQSESRQQAQIVNHLFEQYENAMAEAERAEKEAGDLATGPKRNDPGTQAKIDKKNSEALAARDRAAQLDRQHKEEKELLKKKQDEAQRQREKANDKKKEADAKKKKYEDKYGSSDTKPNSSGDNKRCVNGVGGCDNTCSAMSQAMKQVMSCLTQTQNATPGTPTGPIRPGCDPRVCDPIDPVSPSNSALAQCFGSVNGGGVMNSVQKKCWSMRCAGNEEAAVGGNGACVCRPPLSGGGSGGGRLSDTCANAGRCEDGSAPSYANGACQCGRGPTVVQVPVTKQPGFDVPLPLPSGSLRGGPEPLGYPVPR